MLRVALVRNGSDDLRNDFACTLDLHDVADAQILSRDEIEVVQRRELDLRPADLYRVEHRVRIDRSRPTDVHFDRAQRRLGDVGREFPRDRITRLTSTDDTELRPQRERVHFHDTAVDREVE